MFSINFAAKKLSFDGVSHGRRGSQNSNILPGVAIFNCWNLRCKGSSFQLSFDFSPPKTSATALKLAGFSYLQVFLVVRYWQGSGCQLWTSDSSIFFSGDTRTAICFNRYQFCNHSNCQTTFCRQFIAIWNMLILFYIKHDYVICYALFLLFHMFTTDLAEIIKRISTFVLPGSIVVIFSCHSYLTTFSFHFI